MEWKEIIEEFCLDITIKGFSKVTVKNYSCKLENLADYFIKQNIQPLDLKKMDLKKLIVELQSKRYQASTINITVSRLKKMYDYMLEEKYLSENPCVVKQLKTQQKLIHPLTEEEIRKILAVAKKHKYQLLAQRNLLILMLMLDCGLRISEVVNLNESDILTNQLIIRNSKNNKDRAVVLSPVVKKEIIKYQRIKKKKYHGTDKDAFIVSYKQRRLNEKAIWQILREITQTADTRNMNPHLLRHTYASMQLKNGLDIFTLSLNMGHSEISTTQEYLKSLKSSDFLEKSLETSTLMNL